MANETPKWQHEDGPAEPVPTLFEIATPKDALAGGNEPIATHNEDDDNAPLADLSASDRRQADDAPAADSDSMPQANTGRIHEAQSQLDRAIDELEQMLNQRQSPEGLQASTATNADGQYTIPLLDDVVVPSRDVESPLPSTTPEWDANAERIAHFQPILDRLASELEVIVQTGVDEALLSANKKILQRVRNHIAIVLPEILEELEYEQDRDPSLPDDG
ncbi:MAG: hypothetical protein K0U93_14915 [Gammaproteobacteria bacterium]|nr:hypothetical protein [Gammaproteobacteria bacterium]